MSSAADTDEGDTTDDEEATEKVEHGQLLAVQKVEDDGGEDDAGRKDGGNDAVVHSRLSTVVEGLEQAKLNGQLEEGSGEHGITLDPAELVLLVLGSF